MHTPRNILLMMSGSIACAKATGLVSAWAKQGHTVRVACTRSVTHFVGRSTLEGLGGESVFDDTFEPGRAMDHIALAQWADLLVVCPATANLIAKLATGIADDAVTTLWQAAWGRGKPQFIVPAMNTRMWDYPATGENVARLRSWGVHVLPTADGELACGEHGAGRMLEPEDIMRALEAVLEFDRPRPTGSVLVTGGGTREPIDDVRFIGNHSSGRTAAAMADEFARIGFEVTWLGARSAMAPGERVNRANYETFEDLQTELGRLLAEQHFDLVVHAAAVSDFSVRIQQADNGRHRGKLPSSQALTLQLAPNPKLLNQIREWSRNPDVQVAGFKLTSGASAEAAQNAVRKLLQRGGTDLVVHNDLEEIRMGTHRFRLYDRQGDPGGTCDSPRDLARLLARHIDTAAVLEKSK